MKNESRAGRVVRLRMDGLSPSSGLTVFHTHIHLIPCYKGDVSNPPERSAVRSASVAAVQPQSGNFLILEY